MSTAAWTLVASAVGMAVIGRKCDMRDPIAVLGICCLSIVGVCALVLVLSRP